MTVNDAQNKISKYKPVASRRSTTEVRFSAVTRRQWLD